MTKILFISNIAKKVGSFSIAALKSSQKLGNEFYMVANWSYADKEQIESDEKKYGVHLCHIDLSRNPYSTKNIRAYKQLVDIIKRENIDCIHCNTPVGGLLGRLAGKKCGVKKVIYQAHGFHFYKGAPKKNWLLYYPIEKWLAHYTDAIITINKEDYELAKNKLKLRNNGKVYYVPGVGIDVAQFGVKTKSRDEKREELGIPKDAFVIVSVGELNKNKNNRVIISAMQKLNDKNIHYVLCGTGDQEASLKAQAQTLNLQNNVHFLGYRTDVKEIYRMADCFVMPSYREGLSRSIMEAMASGLPCIVSKIRGNVDLIENGKCGFLCDVEDVLGFSEKIGILAGNPDLCKTMEENNLIKEKKYSVENVAEELFKIYNAELSEK